MPSLSAGLHQSIGEDCIRSLAIILLCFASTLTAARVQTAEDSVRTEIALLGPSGVGKSTLINALADAMVAPRGDVRAYDRKGRHTDPLGTSGSGNA